MLRCAFDAESVAEGYFVRLEPVYRDSPIDELTVEYKVARVPLRMVHKVALASAPFTHIVVHRVGAWVENSLIAKCLCYVLRHSLRLVVGPQVGQSSLHIDLRESFRAVEPASGSGARRDDKPTGFKFAHEIPVHLQTKN